MLAGFHLYRVQGQSMAPTLHQGDYLLVRSPEQIERSPARGDIVVFRALQQPQQSVLKRVVGLPGERVVFEDGTLSIDGEAQVEPYLGGLPPHLGLDAMDFALGSDEYFVMGDNRTHSTDSRHYGPIRRSRIEGRVVCRMWPPLRWGKL